VTPTRSSHRIGLKEGTVRLAPYSPVWPRLFAKERRLLRSVFPSKSAEIEHIGSTAIPGIEAKPIIDLAVRVATFKTLAATIRRLAVIGYAYKGEYGLTGRHFFVKGDPVTHHLHLVAGRSEHWTKWLVFRDFLRKYPEEARLYNAVKKQIARRYARNRDLYTQSKTAIVNDILFRACADQKPSKKSTIHS
jgi:GrpB-like predicted nucleotidyltransferase (UPF0157 family)